MDTTLFNDEHDEVFDDLIARFTSELGQNSLAKGSGISEFWDYLQQCEVYFTSGSYKSGAYSHHMENMFSLHMLNHTVPKKLTAVLRDFGLPESVIKETDIESHSILDGFVAGDGTLYALAKYCQLDPMWTVVLAYYAWYKYIHPKGVHKFIQQSSPTFNSSSPNGARVAIIGDWGTGAYKDGHVKDCPAQLVIDGIMQLDPLPDYIIHLGDVYYAGTKREERKHLIDMLPSTYKGKLFTMNSNHEMYDGANGLFSETIKNPKFKPQNGSTYFSLEIGDWIVVGLDSAYYDQSFLYMDGAIHNGTEGMEQVKFLQKNAAIKGKQLLVLTHHNGIEYNGSDINKTLWNQVVKEALAGKAPDAWYWGHVHNGIVYEDSLEVLKGVTSINGKSPLLRCCGHASMPYGKGTGLFNKDTGENNPGIAYFGETPMDPPKPTLSQHLRVLNGFSVIDIKGSAFNETFYEVSNEYNAPKEVWKS